MDPNLDAWDHSRPYYHGSPLQLSVVRAGSTITQDRDLARVFSHKPSMVSQGFNDSGARSIRHTGTDPGYLYQVSETVTDDDVYPHPTTTRGPGQEWLNRRDLTLRLIEVTKVLDAERLSDSEIAELRKKRVPDTEP